MIAPFLSTGGAAPRASKEATKLAPRSPGSVLPFSLRKPVAAAAVTALLLGATLPIAQRAGAQGESAVGWVERAPSPGDASTEVVLDGTEVPAGAPTVAVDEIIVPYDPDTPGEVVPHDP